MTVIEELNKEFFILNNWYSTKHLKIKQHTPTSLVIQSNSKEKKYVTFFENNRSFKKLHNKLNKIYLNSDYYTVEIKGKIFGEISPMIYLLEYDLDYNLTARKVLKLNKLTTIKKHSNTEFLRIAISFSNKGELHIEGALFAPFKPLINSENKNYKLGTILSNYNEAGFSRFISTVQLSNENWKDELVRHSPSLVIIETPTKHETQMGLWNWSNTKDLEEDLEFIQLLLWCRVNKVRVAIWDTIGLGYLERLPFAMGLVNYVFTVDITKIGRYQHKFNQLNIYPFMHAFHPLKLEDQHEIKIYSRKLLNKLNFQNEGLNIKYKSNVESDTIPLDIFKESYSTLPVIDVRNELLMNYFKDTVHFFTNNKQLQNVVKELLDNDRVYNHYLKLFKREICYSHTFKQRLIQLNKLLHNSLVFTIPTLSIVFTIYSKESFLKAYELLNEQNINHVECIFLVGKIDDYEQIFFDYNKKNIKLYLYEYVNKHYKIKDIVKTDFFALINDDELDKYDSFLIKDLLINTEYNQVIMNDVPEIINTKIIGENSFERMGVS